MKKPEKYTVVGCMSGTSLDGTDLALCQFEYQNENWIYRIISAETIPYPKYWKTALLDAPVLSGLELFRLDHNYGRYLGDILAEFINKQAIRAEYIASHGHTIFHEPGKGGSLQIGNGHEIYVRTGLPVIADFRSLDVALNGQGAPLVPAGDKILFKEYNYCLNLGGFSNISYSMDGILIAFDICPVNIILNHFSQLAGFEFDKNGELGRKGRIIHKLLTKLNEIDFYCISPPKSLGREFIEEKVFPITRQFIGSKEDFLATFYEHISVQVASALNNDASSDVLITGGGAKNCFLIEKIREKTANTLVLPEPLLVDYKEALVFAFLGVLRLKGINNCISSVTGSKADNCGGVIYGQLNS